MPTYPNIKSDRRWRHPWQVVRLFHDGAVAVVSSHRFELAAEVAAYFHDNAKLPDCIHDVRRTPGVSS